MIEKCSRSSPSQGFKSLVRINPTRPKLSAQLKKIICDATDRLARLQYVVMSPSIRRSE